MYLNSYQVSDIATSVHYSFLGPDHRKKLVKLARTINQMETMRKNMPYEVRLGNWSYNFTVNTVDRMLSSLVKDGVILPEKY